MFKTLRSVLKFDREGDRTARRLRRAPAVTDLRDLARRRLPRGVFDYIDGGAEDEVTLADNSAAFRRLRWCQSVLVDVAGVDISTEMFGSRLDFPLILAPTGFTRIADPEGEVAVAQAAARAHIPYTLSTLSTRSIEEVAAVGAGTRWFQLYMWRDRGLVSSLIERVAASGYDALVLTVDTAVFGRRERDVRHGFALPPKLGWDTILDGARHPGWTWRFLRSDPIRFANVVGGDGPGDGSEAVDLAEYINAQFDPTLQWSDVAWLRTEWQGPIVLKGIQSKEDAERAVDAGVDGIVISNHGGRQLDGVPSTVELLPAVARQIDGRTKIICDGGIRRGSDIVKALALGADACMVGRAYLYGLGAAGERGVDHVLTILRDDVRRTMALLGLREIHDLHPGLLREVGCRCGPVPAPNG